VKRRSTDQDIARFFDEKVGCCSTPADARSHPLKERMTRAFEDALLAEGVAGKSVLELGCGEGRLTRRLVRAGAVRATGLDLSANAVAAARRGAQEDGLADRVAFHTGNAAEAALEPHDIVVHNRVICCYEDPEELLANSLPAARSVYAYTIPRTDGVWAALTRVGTVFENADHRLHRRGFRVFVHDPRGVRRAVEAAGFRLKRRGTSLGWLIAIYARSQPQE
jgi:magnesium-protoporphyrin O-methyltransferase